MSYEYSYLWVVFTPSYSFLISFQIENGQVVDKEIIVNQYDKGSTPTYLGPVLIVFCQS